ncbi:PREDICTED: nuclear speckle RNA-binding protein B-like isoform X1 [Camelina sativa]|uniref:Nuclear speckle RNA-binding protein B-like isoform X1 n=1 Tax=Camelina sativa TaxID=90675 RepID=A0ABM0WX19_CAMSA|nr:PREDICTED: nuclear speckle RNA-binding protein B-like isoform X1 [Camelina sativa]
MADGYWNQQQRQYQPPTSSTHHGGPPKRHRSDFEGPPPSVMPSGHDRHSYMSRDEEDRGIPHSLNDTRTIGSAYDRYLQSMQTPSVPSEEADPFNGVGMGRPAGTNMMPGPTMGGRGGLLPPDFRTNGRDMGHGQPDSVGRPSRKLNSLPPDVSNTLYVEGLPSNCSRREVSHIFRPFVGYREVRLVTKDSKHVRRNGDPIVLCFVDFESPACAATALSALQDYRMDEDEPDSKILRLQFSRNPGPRPGQRGGRR